jgi:hypothetical protein
MIRSLRALVVIVCPATYPVVPARERPNQQPLAVTPPRKQNNARYDCSKQFDGKIRNFSQALSPVKSVYMNKNTALTSTSTRATTPQTFDCGVHGDFRRTIRLTTTFLTCWQVQTLV